MSSSPFPTRRAWLATAAAATAPLLAALSRSAWAQDFPSQPIRLVVPFAPGGTTDLLGRLVAEGLRERLGQNVVVENKGGAGGNLGSADVARAAPNGYTLLMATPGPLAINQYTYANPGYDAEKQLVAVSNVATVPNILMASLGSGIKSLEDLLARARAEPGKLNYGSAGIGSTSHLAGELLKSMAGVNLTHIPYKGVAPAMADLLSGQIQVMFDNLPTALPMIEGGRVVALGVTAPRRVSAVAATPAIAEVLPGFAIDSWFGIAAPAGTPEPVLRKLATAIGEFVQQEATRQRILKMGAAPVGSTPEAFAALVKAEQLKFKALVQRAGIRVE